MSAATPNGSFERSLRNRAAIVGIGQTEFSKASGRSELQLACEATRAALDDAGLLSRYEDGLLSLCGGGLRADLRGAASCCAPPCMSSISSGI